METGTGGACPGFRGLPKGAQHRQWLAMGCRGIGLVLGGCLGEPMATLGAMLWHRGWASLAGEANALTDHLSQVPACPPSVKQR